MLKSIFVDQLGNHAFSTLRPSENETNTPGGLFRLKVHNSPLLKKTLPRLVVNNETIPPSSNDSISDNYDLEEGTYVIEWANELKTTVIVQYIGEERAPRVHLRGHYGLDVTFGSSSDGSALPAPAEIPLVTSGG